MTAIAIIGLSIALAGATYWAGYRAGKVKGKIEILNRYEDPGEPFWIAKRQGDVTVLISQQPGETP